jgi:hypothetical protein
VPESVAVKDLTLGLQDLEWVMGTPTFTWKGAEVDCVPSSLRYGTVLSVGGFEYSVQLTLYVRKSHWLTVDTTLVTVDSILYTSDNDMVVPVTGRKCTFRGKVYRVVGCRESGPRSHYELDLADSKQ